MPYSHQLNVHRSDIDLTIFPNGILIVQRFVYGVCLKIQVAVPRATVLLIFIRFQLQSNRFLIAEISAANHLISKMKIFGTDSYYNLNYNQLVDDIVRKK